MATARSGSGSFRAGPPVRRIHSSVASFNRRSNSWLALRHCPSRKIAFCPRILTNTATFFDDGRTRPFGATFPARASAANAWGLPQMLHICGKTEAILADIILTGAGALELDCRTGARLAHDVLFRKVTFVGNLDPTGASWLWEISAWWNRRPLSCSRRSRIRRDSFLTPVAPSRHTLRPGTSGP